MNENEERGGCGYLIGILFINLSLLIVIFEGKKLHDRITVLEKKVEQLEKEISHVSVH